MKVIVSMRVVSRKACPADLQSWFAVRHGVRACPDQ